VETRVAKVEIYTTPFCGFCSSAKSLLKKKGVAYEEIDIMFHPSRRGEMMERAGGRHTVPQIFIDDRHVGGCDDLHALDHAGRLDGLLAGTGGE
jgi:glutaredoxin 3